MYFVFVCWPIEIQLQIGWVLRSTRFSAQHNTSKKSSATSPPDCWNIPTSSGRVALVWFDSEEDFPQVLRYPKYSTKPPLKFSPINKRTMVDGGRVDKRGSGSSLGAGLRFPTLSPSFHSTVCHQARRAKASCLARMSRENGFSPNSWDSQKTLSVEIFFRRQCIFCPVHIDNWLCARRMLMAAGWWQEVMASTSATADGHCPIRL